MGIQRAGIRLQKEQIAQKNRNSIREITQIRYQISRTGRQFPSYNWYQVNCYKEEIKETKKVSIGYPHKSTSKISEWAVLLVSSVLVIQFFADWDLFGLLSQLKKTETLAYVNYVKIASTWLRLCINTNYQQHQLSNYCVQRLFVPQTVRNVCIEHASSVKTKNFLFALLLMENFHGFNGKLSKNKGFSNPARKKTLL